MAIAEYLIRSLYPAETHRQPDIISKHSTGRAACAGGCTPRKRKSPNKPVEASQFWESHNSAAATDVDSTAGASGCFVAELRGCGAKILKSAAAKLQKRGLRWPDRLRLATPPALSIPAHSKSWRSFLPD
jgi:hypothetical protein